MHPAEKIKGIKSNLLLNKKIILGVTGSIAAEETVKLARELIRYGADVQAVMTESAKKIITVDSLKFATGTDVIDYISGGVEHVDLLDRADLLLIAPCSVNTLSKIATGIADSTVSLFAATALGSLKILIAPAMHDKMYNNPVIKNNVKALERYGLLFVPPKIQENKAKMADVETIVAYVIRTLNEDYKNKKVLVIGGGSVEHIDDVRTISNLSTGETALELAKNAFYLGADVTLLIGTYSVSIPPYIKTEHFDSVSTLIADIPKMLGYDYILVPAALSDFTVEKSAGKISSDKSLNLELVPNPKFILSLRNKYKNVLVGFKAEYGISDELLLKKGQEKLKKYNLEFLIANDLKKVKEGYTEILFIEKNNYKKLSGSKSDVTLQILKMILR
ncbi:MAG: bifunctional phosphopantothenoylcysteine decarboxylase/phosphopantothenate--cysteine ligase CoaBC [Thermoplasmata archaeon]